MELPQGVLATAGSGELPFDATKVSDSSGSEQLESGAVVEALRTLLIQVCTTHHSERSAMTLALIYTQL